VLTLPDCSPKIAFNFKESMKREDENIWVCHAGEEVAFSHNE